MPYCKKINTSLMHTALFFVLLMLFSTLANSAGIYIKNAELIPFEDEFILNSNAEVKLNEEIEEALLKGFELHFVLEFQLASPRKYWFDDEIITVTYPLQLSYHPLSRQYLLTQAGQQKSYASLDEVIRELSNLHNIKVFKKSEVEKGEHYKALLLLRLDYKKLPKTIQDDAIGADKWDMTSQRFEWSPTFVK